MSRKTDYKAIKQKLSRNWGANALLIIGVIVAAISILALKNQHQEELPATESFISDESPEQQYDRYLAEGESIFLFFHSNNCYACLEMIETVAQVFPEYMDEVKLIDVNVYDARNQTLLRRVKITAIPTQIFINPNGEQQAVMGAMIPDDLRSYLSKAAGHE